jgi:hypothetical protein
LLYQKKPVTVEAIQFNGANWTEIIELAGEAFGGLEHSVDLDKESMVLRTKKGDWMVSKFDWVLRDVSGAVHVMANVVFGAIYEPKI